MTGKTPEKPPETTPEVTPEITPEVTSVSELQEPEKSSAESAALINPEMFATKEDLEKLENSIKSGFNKVGDLFVSQNTTGSGVIEPFNFDTFFDDLTDGQ